MFCEIRDLDSSDLHQLLESLKGNLETHLFVASRASELLSKKSNTSVLGYFEDGDLIGGVLYGPNLVPFNLNENAAVEIGKFLSNLSIRCASIVGAKTDVEILWANLANFFPAPRLVRERQLLFVLNQILPVHEDSKVRLVADSDLDAYTSASIEMFTSEVGLPPFNLVDYRQRVRSQISANLSYGWFAGDGRVLFKVDVGSHFDGFCQLQGVWLHPDLRGRGFSTELLHMAINLIQKQHTPKITLYVNDFNKPAVALYEHLGFVGTNEFQTIFF
jgi:predicted GNAT family acetyltransferase